MEFMIFYASGNVFDNLPSMRFYALLCAGFKPGA